MKGNITKIMERTETIVYKTHINENFTTRLLMNDNLSKKDLRVCLFLFTKISGYMVKDDVSIVDKRLKDFKNFQYIDVEAIADTLDMKKKEVRKAIEHLNEEGVLESGTSETVRKGYRFTF